MNPVRKELDAIIGKGHNGYRVFEDWVGLMFYAFQRDDPPYLEIMGQYRNTEPVGQRAADHFANATAYLLDYMRATSEETLGMKNTRRTITPVSISLRLPWRDLWPG